MVNRVIQQKVLKQKRMRRAYLKKFSLKNTGPVKYPGYFDDQGDWVDMSLHSRSQAAKVQNLDSQLSEHLRKRFRFKKTDPESIYARHRGLHTDLTRDGEIILARLVQSRGNAGSLQGEERFVRKVYINKPERLTSLYMSGSTNFFIEVRTNSEGTYFFKSIDYPDRHTAERAYVQNRILWAEITEPTADKS